MRKGSTILVIIILLITASCSDTKSPTATENMTTQSTPTTTIPTLATDNTVPEATVTIPDYKGLPLPLDKGSIFSGSGACTSCHTRMIDEAGANSSLDSAWRATMMANAARDPYWQASVRYEVLDHPAFRDVIEGKCATCHMPMAHFSAKETGGSILILDDGFTSAGHQLHVLAMDGVSCTLCHQIEEAYLGQTTSFSGGFAIDTSLSPDSRNAFGPFEIEPLEVGIMQSASGFVPLKSEHIKGSQMCSTCHTLFTPYFDAKGQIAGEFPEQTTYIEWKYSDYSEIQACQDCHMPTAAGGVHLSATGGVPRSPFHNHNFVGGNTYILSILRAFGDQIGVTASSRDFTDKISQIVKQLSSNTATIIIEDAKLSGYQLVTDVSVRNLAGHKFPTGFPSRRVWIHFTVKDSSDQVIFESGAIEESGFIVGNDNDKSQQLYETHYEVIEDDEQVQIYETILRDTLSNVTTALLKASGYAKDNRLLPSGFEKQGAVSDILVHGEALTDENFTDEGDTLRYIVNLPDSQDTYMVSAELLYQPVGYRWIENLNSHEANEIGRFLEYDESDLTITHSTVATDTLRINE